MENDLGPPRTTERPSPAQAQVLLSKLSPGHFRALHASRTASASDSKTRWKCRAYLIASGLALARERGLTKRPAEDGSLLEADPSFPNSNKLRIEVRITETPYVSVVVVVTAR